MTTPPRSPDHPAMSMTMPLSRSARSSASSSAPSHLLTPVYELDSMPDSAVASSSGSSSSGTDERDRDADVDGDINADARGPGLSGSDDHGDDTPRGEHGMGKHLALSSSTTRRGRHSAPSLVPLESPPLANSSFSFGSCPSVPLSATPTSELGPFDYPLPPVASASSFAGPSTTNTTTGVHHANPFGSPRRQSLALGMTHRRGSIVATSRSPVEPSSSTLPSPPAARRSSTCSTITTLPAAGHRPAILHSASTTSGPAGLTHPPSYPHLLTHAQSPPTSRRSSLLFPQRPSATPIPPSLLARRGSLPAAQLFGVPSSEMALNRLPGGLAQRERASFAGFAGLPGQAAPPGYTTTTPALYARRASLLSDDGTAGSGSSTSTITMDDVARSRRSSAFPQPFTSPSAPTSPRQPKGAQRRLQPSPAEGRPGGPEGNPASVQQTSASDHDEQGRRQDGCESPKRDLDLPAPNAAEDLVGFTDPWATSTMKRALEEVPP